MSAVPIDQVARLLRQRLAEGQAAFLHISSGSMVPLLRPLDQVEICRATPEKLHVFDLVLLQAPAALFSHRYWGSLASARGLRLVTRGDRMLSFDPLWESDQLLGKIAGWRRQAAYYDLRSPAGQVLNERLGRLARQELALFASLYREPGLALLPDGQTPAINFSQVDRSRPLTFALRRLVKTWATTLTAYYLPQMRA